MTLLDFPPFRLDADRRTLLREGEAVPLPRKAFDTLVALIEKRGAVVAKDELMKRVWNDAFVEENSLNQSISALRKALGDSAAAPRFIETVPGLGYRFLADVSASAAARPPKTRPRSLAVLPLRAIGADEDAALGIGIADSVITRLSNVHDLAVRPTSAVLHLTSPADAGRQLGVDAVLEGSIRRSGDRLRVTVQLVSVGSDTPIWAGTFDESFTEIFAVEDSISYRVAEALMVRLSVEERSLLVRRATENSEVYRLYLNGRWHANRLTAEDSARAVECFEQAVALDPGYGLGYAGLAYQFFQCADLTMASREAMTRAEEAARKALAIDEALVDARVTLAAVRFFFDWDAPTSLREFERALSLEPRNAHARHLYGWCLTLMGKLDAAVAEMRLADEIDPQSHENALYYVPTLYFARRYAEALRSARTVVERDPELWLARVLLGRVLEAQGDLASAIASYEEARRIDASIHESLFDLGRALGRAGLTQRAQDVLAELDARRANGPVPAFAYANVYLGLGDFDRALAAIDDAIAERSWYVTWLRVAPMLDPLRADERFTARLRALPW